MIERGQQSIGMRNAQVVIPTLPAEAGLSASTSYAQQLEIILQRLEGLETVIEGKADANKIKTLIQYSDELIRIQADQIALVGSVTFLDVWRDQTGQSTGELDPSMTLIRGGVIQTGIIKGNGYGPTSGIAINLDDDIIVAGGYESPKLLYADGDLTITGTLTASSIIIKDVVIQGLFGDPTLEDIYGEVTDASAHLLASGNVHNLSLGQVNGDLDDIDNGSTYKKSTASQNTGGTRAYNSLDSAYDYIRALSTDKIVISGSTPSTGVIFDQLGLRAYDSGSPTLVLNTGSGGGTFSGDVVTSGQLLSTGQTLVGGQWGAVVGVATGSGIRGLLGTSVNGPGVVGYSDNREGGYFKSDDNSHAGLLCSNTGGGPALEIEQGDIVKSKTTTCLVELWNVVDGLSVGNFYYEFREI